MNRESVLKILDEVVSIEIKAKTLIRLVRTDEKGTPDSILNYLMDCNDACYYQEVKNG